MNQNPLFCFCDCCQIRLATLIVAVQHFCGKRHQSKIWCYKIEKPGIFITDIRGLKLSDVLQHFAQYGIIRTIRGFTPPGQKKPNTAKEKSPQKPEEEESPHFARLKIVFEQMQSVQDVLNTGHTIKGKRLNVIRNVERSVPAARLEVIETVELIDFKEVDKLLETIYDPEEQMEQLMKYLELTEGDIHERSDICVNVQKTIRTMYPNCIVFPFGSTVNGLGFRGCDTDAYVDLGIPGTDKGQTLERHHQETAVKEVTKALRQLQTILGGVQGIAQARVPIVKFVHRKTNLWVDLSFSNKMSVLNTEYIRHCMEADSRVRFVTTTVRYWAKVHRLSGGGKGGRSLKITNYALTMMVIFYMQVKQILHPLKTLQADMTEGDSIKIDHWECGYSTSLDGLPQLGKSNKTVGLLELLHGFFHYFADFDYKTLAICPLVGQTMPKEVFAETCQNQNEPLLNLYWQNVSDGKAPLLAYDSTLVVQDPFEQNHNLTKGYSEKALDIWKEACKQTSEITQSLLDSKTVKYEDGLGKMFHLNVQPPLTAGNSSKGAVSVSLVGSSQVQFSISISSKASQIASENEEQELFHNYHRVLLETMQDIFKMDCKPVNLPQDHFKDCQAQPVSGEKPVDPSSNELKPVDPSSNELKPDDLPSSKLQEPVDPTGSKTQEPVNPTSSTISEPVNPAIPKPVDPSVALRRALFFDEPVSNQEETSSDASSPVESVKRSLSTSLADVPEEKRRRRTDLKTGFECSSTFPLWDFRKSARKELAKAKSDHSYQTELEISQHIVDKYATPDFSALEPEIVFGMAIHLTEKQDVCVHVTTKKSRKNTACRVLNELSDFLPQFTRQVYLDSLKKN